MILELKTTPMHAWHTAHHANISDFAGFDMPLWYKTVIKKECLGQFIEALETIAKEAVDTPELPKSAPHIAKVSRLDEVTAARKPCLKG